MQRAIRRAGRHFMPAEWVHHERTLMAWPAASSLQHFQLSAARSEVIAIANTISRFEPVTMFVSPADTQGLRQRLDANVSVIQTQVENLWIKDTGPVFSILSDRNIHGLNFSFNY